MLIVLGLVVLLIVVILLYRNTKNDTLYGVSDGLRYVFGGLVILSLIIISVVNIDKKIDYEIMINKRIEIVSKIEALEIQSGKDIDFGIYSDVFKEKTNFNNQVMKHKYRSKSLWFNWFYNDLIGEIEYIEQIKLKENKK